MNRLPGLILLFAVPALCGAAAQGAEAPAPENHARKARISASSEFSKDYQGKFVADGKIPGENSHADVGEAWAVKGDTHRNGAELAFEWDAAVTIAQIVYHGRTAWGANECWKDYEVHLDGEAQPAAKGRFEETAEPQPIVLPAPASARKLVLKFTSSYGGFNPGASEVQIFSVVPPPKPVRESALRRRFLDGGLGFRTFVVIQRCELNPSHVYTYHVEDFRAGGGLCLFTPDEGKGTSKELVASPQGQILDCDVSYDGQEILFSWRKDAKATYQVYCIKADGTGLKQITSDASHNFNACWLPDGGIGFLSTRKPQFAYCWTSPVGTLFRMDRDGGNQVRLSANYLNDFTPAVTHDGRIIYSRWEYVDRPAIPIQSLWTINPDGTRLAGFYGNRVLSPATFMEPRPIPGSTTFLCLLTAHNGPCRGGVGVIDIAYGDNAQASIRNLTPEVNIGQVEKGDGNFIRGPYENPFPVDGECFVVSKRGAIVLRDYEGTDACELLKPRGLGFYNPVPLRAHTRPPIVASGLPEHPDAGWATVFLQDVYNGLEPYVKRGDVKQIAVVQEIEKAQLASLDRRAFGFQFPVVSCGATYAPKKVWGYVPVAEDGSAAFKVPAGVPLYFMALDAEGRAVQRMRSFTHFMPGEIQGCVGCHDSRQGAPRPGQDRAAAMYRSTAPPRTPTPPEWGLGGFTYARIVQPVLDKHCVPCHSGIAPPKGVDLSGDLTDYFNVSYETLARENRRAAKRYTSWICTENGNEANILIITPRAWGSPASEVADLILSGHPDKDGKPRVNMDETSRRRVFAWIDLNAPYYGTSLFTHGDRQGCRQMSPPNLDKTLQAVAQKRCAACHNQGKSIPRRAWVRVTHPELNSFLVAPLAKAAGGTERCGQAVFASKDDPDYQAILKTFEPIHELLKQKPREDMPGGEPAGTCAPTASAR
jgi:hypothetical protein